MRARMHKIVDLLVLWGRDRDLKLICEGWEIQAGIWINHWEQQEIMMTLAIVLGIDKKVGRKEIWEKTAPHGRVHQ